MTHIRFWRYVSPVVPINAIATAIRTHTIGGLPTNRARVCGCAFAQPRRDDARRSWSNVRLCIAKIVFLRQTFAPQRKSGGRKPPVVNLDANAPATGTGTLGGLP
jgi:hypothetical protein